MVKNPIDRSMAFPTAVVSPNVSLWKEAHASARTAANGGQPRHELSARLGCGLSRPEERNQTLSSRFSLPAAVVALTLVAVGCFYVSRVLFLGFLYGIALVTIAFLAIAIPRFRRIKNRALSKQTRWAFRLHTVRSVLVALAAMALILMMLGSFEAPFIFVFAAVIPYLFFGVPAVGALIANLLKGKPDAELFYKDRWVWVSRLLTSFAWVISAAVMALALAVFQSWPFSLREGPDAEWSRPGFEAAETPLLASYRRPLRRRLTLSPLFLGTSRPPRKAKLEPGAMNCAPTFEWEILKPISKSAIHLNARYSSPSVGVRFITPAVGPHRQSYPYAPSNASP